MALISDKAASCPPCGTPQDAPSLSFERLAYWYLRLNGFLQIENFIVHDEKGSERTDADLLGIRFRHRTERFFDAGSSMVDDAALNLSTRYDDAVIVEVKSNQPCSLNGPWTKPERQNVHRTLAAIGCLPLVDVPKAAECIYEDGVAIFGRTRIRLVSIGGTRSDELGERYPDVLQLTWASNIIGFVWDRFDDFFLPKEHVERWSGSSADGKRLRDLAKLHSRKEFIAAVGRQIGLTQWC